VKESTSKRPTDRRPLFLAGDPALDFLNTLMRVGGEVQDLLQNDEDVLAWLADAGFPASNAAGSTAPLSLLRAARELREHIRLLVQRRKAGRRGNPSVLNRFLGYARSHPWLVWKKPQSLTIERVRQQDTPETMLAPVAEAAAMLLATADFSLVKHCEGETCVLWFCDQTKSHHRRWCSTRICGNRSKVAAYRKRERDRGASEP
jgi:predicted RNA-binding Zn ribbon-like protein